MPLLTPQEPITDADGRVYVPTGLVRHGAQAEVWHAVTDNGERDSVVIRATPLCDHAPSVDPAASLSSVLRTGWMRPLAIGRTDACAFLVYPRAAGGDLEQLVHKHGRLTDPARAAGIAIKVAEAIAQAHAAGVYHNDLKPDNVVIDNDRAANPEPQIIDLGLGSGDGDQITLGKSPGFAPPEAIRGEPVTRPGAADVFGIGAVLFYLLTAQPPNGKTPVECAARTAAGNEPVNRSLREHALRDAGTPDGLARVVLSCLEPDPSERPAQASAVAESLRAAISTEPKPRQAWARTAAVIAASLLIGATAGALTRDAAAKRSIMQANELTRMIEQRLAEAEAERDEAIDRFENLSTMVERFSSRSSDRFRSQRWSADLGKRVDNFPNLLYVMEMLGDTHLMTLDVTDVRMFVERRMALAGEMITATRGTDAENHLTTMLVELCYAAWVYQEGETRECLRTLDQLIPRLITHLAPTDSYLLGAIELRSYARTTARGEIPVKADQSQDWVMQMVSNQVRVPGVVYDEWSEPPAPSLAGINPAVIRPIAAAQREYTQTVIAWSKLVNAKLAEGHSAVDEANTFSENVRAIQDFNRSNPDQAIPEPPPIDG